MPKLKTHKGAQARFSITGSGKIMRTKIGKSHLRIHKPKRVKRVYGDKTVLSETYETKIKRLLPYGVK